MTTKNIKIENLLFSSMRSNKLESEDAKIKAAAQALCDNIAKHGIISALVVYEITEGENKGKFLIAGGNQRGRCAQRLGMESVPCDIKGSATISEIAAIEVSLNHAVIPQTKKEYMDKVKFALERGETVEEIARSWGIDIRTISAWAEMQKMPEEIKEKVIKGDLPFTAVDIVTRQSGKKLSDEEKIAIVKDFTRDTTVEQAKALRDATIAKKKADGVRDTLSGKAPVVTVEVKNPIFSVSRAGEIFNNVTTLRAAGRSDAEFLLVALVIDYIYGESKDNPFKA